MFRIDMSEYMERHSVSRLIGAPPGYVGYEEGGIFTEAVRRRPYQVILLDEYEKAHRDVSNLLLQVFDEGRLTDSHGRIADFKNTVILLTSNLGNDVLYGDKTLNNTLDIQKHRHKAALQLVNSAFSPEFVNRLDEVLCFSPLGTDAIRSITQIQLEKVKRLLREKEIEIDISVLAADWLSEEGYSEHYGARPLKRLIQASVLNPLANLILENKIAPGSRIQVKEQSEENIMGLKALNVEISDPTQNHLKFYI